MSELTKELVESLQSLIATCNNPPDYDPHDEFDTSFERAAQSIGEFVDNNSAAIVGGLSELLALRSLRDAGAKEKLIRMVRLMCLDNDMGTESVEKWRFGWNLPVLLEQASRIPDEEIDTFTAGEESDVEALVVKCDCRDLHDWLNEVFEDDEPFDEDEEEADDHE